MSAEIELLQNKLLEVTNEQEMKVKMSQQQLVSSDEQMRLLNEHIAKLQDVI